MSHSPPHGYGLVNTFDLPGDEEDIDTRIRCSTQESLHDHRSPSSGRVSTDSNSTIDVVSSGKHETFVVTTTDMVVPTLVREISIDSPTTPKISPRQRKSSNVASSDLPAPPPPVDHDFCVIPSLDSELHTPPPIQTPRKVEQHTVISLPNPTPESAKKFDETYGLLPINAGLEGPREYSSCWGYVNASLLTCIISIALLLLISSAPNIPAVQLESLSMVKFNATTSRESKLEVKGTWDFKLSVKNHETKWRGTFHSMNCTLYKQREHRNFYEEEARNLVRMGNTSMKEPFSLAPEEEKELQLKMKVMEMQDLEFAGFVLWISVYVSFDRASFQWYSGTLNYNCGTLTLDQHTGMLSNHLPVPCKFSLPLL